ncbi:hypothetical protein [Halomonas sp. PGE1]|uniref:hypothetical protein n=1 Tax=Halomonas sp. PGE1 TaxID=2730360 RepID=UPI0014758914|nr:hypothetical protein [Halomonas sp. PGE1]QJQ99328.1 hypothetical protein HIR79_11905 [Halomonas sp. PGE1]
MTYGVQYPAEIRANWAEAVDVLELDPGENNKILSIVAYAQPPLYFEAFTAASTLYAADHGITVSAGSLDAIRESVDISSATPERTGSYFPVYYALTHPKKLGNLQCHASQFSRTALSNLFQEVASGRLVSRHRFYQHVVDTRDVMMAVIASGWQPKSASLTREKALLAAVHKDAFYGLIDKKLASKIEHFEMIIKGEIEPGKIQQQRMVSGGGGRGGEIRSTTKKDEWHAERVSELAKQSMRPRTTRRSTTRAIYSRDTMVDTSLRDMGMQAKTAPDGHGANESTSETLILYRPTPSMQTPADDCRLVRGWMAGAPTTSLKSVTDLARLTPDQVDRVMSSCLTPVCQLFATLLLSTGLPPARLASLAVKQSCDLEAIITSTNERPYWLPEHQLIVYRLLDGPVPRDTSPAATWVMLALPASLASALTGLEVPFPRRPFQGVGASLNQQLRRMFADSPGITPTAHRLSASSWLYCRPDARDDVAAASLSGQFGLGLAAPAAYRRIPRAEHQEIFEQVLRQLGWEVPASSPQPNTPMLILHGCMALAGSGVAQPASAFAELFQWLRDAMKDPGAELARWWTGEPVPLTAVTTLHQLVSSHELLAWHLASGARPIGPSSEHCLAGELQWVDDKASALGHESRVIPLLASIRNSLQAYHQWTKAILTRVAEGHMRLDDQRTAKVQTPHWMTPSRSGRSVTLRDMRWQDMASLPPLATWPNNVCRHSTASWLREHCPDAVVDHLLGHTRHGRMLSSPRTEATLGQQHELRRALTEWLSQCGYRPLNWRLLPWW